MNSVMNKTQISENVYNQQLRKTKLQPEKQYELKKKKEL